MARIWRIPESYPDELIAEYDRECSPDRFFFVRALPAGKSISTPTFRIRCQLRQLDQYTSIPNNSGSPLVSSRLASWLQERIDRDCEFIDARIFAEDGQRKDYVLLNVLKQSPAANLRESDIMLLGRTTQILGFRKLVLLEEAPELPSIFRDSNYLPHIMVREDLATEIASASFDGLALLHANEIDW